MKKFSITLLILIIGLGITSCSKHDDLSSQFEYHEGLERELLFVTANSAMMYGSADYFALITEDKTLLETPNNIKKALELVYSGSSDKVMMSYYLQKYQEYEYLDGLLITGLKPNTIYYYIIMYQNYAGTPRAYFRYGPINSFTTDKEITETVDLGLSVKWRGYNLGADTPYETGSEYMWGYTKPGYVSTPNYPIEKDIINTEYDAAHVELGGNWRMASYLEGEELAEKCKVEKVICTARDNGIIFGFSVTGPSGNKIFVPMSDPNTSNPSVFVTCRFWIGYDHNYYSAYNSHTGTGGEKYMLPIRAVID